MPSPSSEPVSFRPRIIRRPWFERLEAKAREVLRERGFTEEMIEAELHMVKRRDLDLNLAGPSDETDKRHDGQKGGRHS